MNQNIFNVKSGGGQVAKRNYDSIRDCLNKNDELYTCIISTEVDKFQAHKDRLMIPELKGNFQCTIAALQNCKCCEKKYEKYIWKFVEEIDPDIVYLDTSKLGTYAKYIKQYYRCKVIAFFHNVEADYSMNSVQLKGWPYLLSYWTSVMNEKMIVRYADKLICLTKRDNKRIKELYGRTVDEIIPVSFRDKYNEDKVGIISDNGLLFIGSLFPPNYDGIKWFVDKVMSKLPEQTLTIVGKDFETKKDALETKNVTVIGTVDDLEKYYYAYPILIMPIRYGAGMKVKTAEAMMYAKIIIATNEALEGYEIPESCGVYRCNSVQEFVSVIKQVSQSNIDYKNNDIRHIFLKQYEYKITQRQFENVIK